MLPTDKQQLDAYEVLMDLVESKGNDDLAILGLMFIGTQLTEPRVSSHMKESFKRMDVENIVDIIKENMKNIE